MMSLSISVRTFQILGISKLSISTNYMSEEWHVLVHLGIRAVKAMAHVTGIGICQMRGNQRVQSDGTHGDVCQEPIQGS